MELLGDRRDKCHSTADQLQYRGLGLIQVILQDNNKLFQSSLVWANRQVKDSLNFENLEVLGYCVHVHVDLQGTNPGHTFLLVVVDTHKVTWTNQPFPLWTRTRCSQQQQVEMQRQTVSHTGEQKKLLINCYWNCWSLKYAVHMLYMNFVMGLAHHRVSAAQW